jgi:hypothetical protein
MQIVSANVSSALLMQHNNQQKVAVSKQNAKGGKFD